MRTCPKWFATLLTKEQTIIKQKTNPQAQATLEIAKGLFAIADALKAKGATLPPIAETPAMKNPLDGAIVEVAKGVHQVAKGVETLPATSNGQGNPTVLPDAPLVWRGVINVPEAQQKSHDISISVPEMFYGKDVVLYYKTNTRYSGYTLKYITKHREQSIGLVDGYSNWNGVSQIEVIFVHINPEHYELLDASAATQYKFVDQNELY